MRGIGGMRRIEEMGGIGGMKSDFFKLYSKHQRNFSVHSTKEYQNINGILKLFKEVSFFSGSHKFGRSDSQFDFFYYWII